MPARALDFAYRDVLAAYEEFLREAPPDRPIILAAHSQGSAHLMRLLAGADQGRARGEARGRGLCDRLADLAHRRPAGALPFPACERPDQARCILAWQSFAEPADPSQVTDVYDESVRTGRRPAGGHADALHQSADRRARRRGARGAPISALWSPTPTLSDAEFRRGAVAARCGPRGFLLIGDNAALPAMGPYALPGNNYHVYDYALFWANIRADAERRLAAFERRGQ